MSRPGSDPASPDPAVDGVLGRFARRVSDRYSRRSLFFTASSAVAGFFGVQFLAPFVSDTTMSMAFGAPAPRRCTHPDDCTKEGRKCAMGAGVDCSAYGKKVCKACLNADGCPGKTVKGGSWRGCCLCPKDPKNGHYFDYVDCCGTDADITGTPDCVEKGCVKAVDGSGCPGDIQESDCIGQSSETSWCGGVPGDAQCTFAVQDGSCTIGS